MSHVDYPVCLRLQDRRVLVVGAGFVATQRIAGLLDAGAIVTVVAPDVRDSVWALACERLTIIQRPFVDADIDEAQIVFVAVNDLDVSVHVTAIARARGLLVNAADIPPLCDFSLPAVGRDGPITVAVSTSGQAPALARRLKDLLMAQIPARHGEVIRVVRALRRAMPAGPARMQFIRGVVDGDIGAALLSGQRRRAFALLRRALSTAAPAAPAAPATPATPAEHASLTSFTSTTVEVSQ
jgi:precorrin-2 dehydrogenase/sirohydrochlorin ferrochelatase